MLSHLLSLRTFITDGRSLSDAVLVKPTLVFEPSSKMDEDEDQIELLESNGNLPFNEFVTLWTLARRNGSSMDQRAQLRSRNEKLLLHRPGQESPADDQRRD